MDTNNTEELFHELFVLWALYLSGGEANDEVLYNKWEEISKLNHGKSLEDITKEMIKSGFPEDKLTRFFEMHGISIDLKELTIH